MGNNNSVIVSACRGGGVPLCVTVGGNNIIMTPGTHYTRVGNIIVITTETSGVTGYPCVCRVKKNGLRIQIFAFRGQWYSSRCTYFTHDGVRCPNTSRGGIDSPCCACCACYEHLHICGCLVCTRTTVNNAVVENTLAGLAGYFDVLTSDNTTYPDTTFTPPQDIRDIMLCAYTYRSGRRCGHDRMLTYYTKDPVDGTQTPKHCTYCYVHWRSARGTDCIPVNRCTKDECTYHSVNESRTYDKMCDNGDYFNLPRPVHH